MKLNHNGHEVYKCARVGGHTEKFVFPWFNSCYRPFIFHLCIILYNFLVCNILLEIVCYIDVLCCICKIYIHPFSKRFFHRERYIDRHIVLLCCTCSRAHFSLLIVQLVKKLSSTINSLLVRFFVPICQYKRECTNIVCNSLDLHSFGIRPAMNIITLHLWGFLCIRDAGCRG